MRTREKPFLMSCLAVQPDGSVLAGGEFSSLGGQPRSRIARFSADGIVEAGFDPGASNSVYTVALQPDGKVLVGGSFTNLAGTACNYIGRLNADVTFDSTFNPGASGSVQAIALQSDGKVLAAGSFTNIAGLARSNICPWFNHDD